MNKTKRICLPLLFMLILAIGCKKPDDRPCPSTTHDIPIGAILQGYLFGNGSQWVYRRTSDSLMDTVTLTNIVRTFYEYESGGTAAMTGGCTSKFSEELFTLYYASTVTGHFREDMHYDDIRRSGNPSGLAFWGGQVGSSKQDAVIEAIHDSLSIDPNTFSHVTQIQTSVGALEEHGLLRLYYCPSIGIVRKEIMWGDSVHNTYDLLAWQLQPYP